MRATAFFVEYEDFLLTNSQALSSGYMQRVTVVLVRRSPMLADGVTKGKARTLTMVLLCHTARLQDYSNACTIAYRRTQIEDITLH
jgi:hypothetical protein